MLKRIVPVGLVTVFVTVWPLVFVVIEVEVGAVNVDVLFGNGANELQNDSAAGTFDKGRKMAYFVHALPAAMLGLMRAATTR